MLPRFLIRRYRWSTQTFTIATMTPVWIFPAYPLLVVGPLASLLCGPTFTDQPRALTIAIAGFTCQGIGFLVSMTIYSAFIYRLMTQKLPQENIRPGMFVSVGPSGFTCAAVAGIAGNAPYYLPNEFMGDGKLAGAVLKVVGSFACLWFWGYVFTAPSPLYISQRQEPYADISSDWRSGFSPSQWARTSIPCTAEAHCNLA